MAIGRHLLDDDLMRRIWQVRNDLIVIPGLKHELFKRRGSKIRVKGRNEWRG